MLMMYQPHLVSSQTSEDVGESPFLANRLLHQHQMALVMFILAPLTPDGAS